VVVAVILLLVAAVASAKDQALPHTSDVSNPLLPLSSVPAGSGARWQAAIALLPDPIDTRLGRTFDIQVATLIRSFQFEGYVLQSHALPWQLDDSKGEQRHHLSPGVLVFRRDRWRNNAGDGVTTPVSYYALFLVGESPVFGIQRVAFCQALLQAAALNQGGDRPLSADSRGCSKQLYGELDAADVPPSRVMPATRLTVLGPNFSGSLPSLADSARRHGVHLQLLSHSATVESNDHIDFKDGDASVHFVPMATWNQARQMRALFLYLSRQHGICPGEVVVLAEESAFGQGAVGREEDTGDECKQMKRPRYVQFPQNISAIRAEHAFVASQRKGKKVQLVPTRYLEMDMKEAAESPDLPQIYRPSLSSRSDELSLQQLMDALATYARPRAVLIVATDVRDRIFMLGAVRRAMPGAIPAVLEGDHLLSHPEYRRANRGTLMVSSGSMLLCFDRVQSKQASPRLGQVPCRGRGFDKRYLAFPTDDAANLFRASRSLLDVDQPAAHNPRQDAGDTPLTVITLAGIQPLPILRGADPSSSGALIAADLRLLTFRLVVPALVVLSILLVICSLWLSMSSRPARLMLSLPGYALREVGWWLDTRLVRRRETLRGRSAPQPRVAERTATTELLCALLAIIALVLLASTVWKWMQMLRGPSLDMQSIRATLTLVHGRDFSMLLVLACLYLWGSLLVIGRIDGWNARCRLHWQGGKQHIKKEHYTLRRFHWSAVLLAMLALMAPFVAWLSDPPDTVDPTGPPAWLALLIMLFTAYFLAQAVLQSQRLARLGRGIRDHILPPLKAAGLHQDWPTPDLLGMPPRSPLTAPCRDSDLHALATDDTHWPWVPQPVAPAPALTAAELEAKHEAWCKRTVAEMRFGLTCVRSCLWAAFLGPIAVLVMIQVHPFAFEWEQSAIALGMLTLAFLVMVQLVVASERAPLIGQMFTPDGSRVSTVEVFRAVSGKFLVLLLTLAATLTPSVGEWLQNLVSMLRI